MLILATAYWYARYKFNAADDDAIRDAQPWTKE